MGACKVSLDIASYPKGPVYRRTGMTTERKVCVNMVCSQIDESVCMSINHKSVNVYVVPCRTCGYDYKSQGLHQGKPPSVHGKVPQPWHHWHFGPDNSSLGGACPGHYRACDVAMSLTRHTTCDNQYCLHMLPSAPWERNHHIDNHWRMKDT